MRWFYCADGQSVSKESSFSKPEAIRGAAHGLSAAAWALICRISMRCLLMPGSPSLLNRFNSAEPDVAPDLKAIVDTFNGTGLENAGSYCIWVVLSLSLL